VTGLMIVASVEFNAAAGFEPGLARTPVEGVR